MTQSNKLTLLIDSLDNHTHSYIATQYNTMQYNTSEDTKQNPGSHVHHTSLAFFLAFVTMTLRALPDGCFSMVTEAVLTLCIFK
jgi:hypothetical protein